MQQANLAPNILGHKNGVMLRCHRQQGKFKRAHYAQLLYIIRPKDSPKKELQRHYMIRGTAITLRLQLSSQRTYLPNPQKMFHMFPMFPQNSLSFNALSKWSSVPLLGGQCTDMCCSPHATARMRRWASCASLKWLSGTLYLVTLPESPSTAGHHKTSVFDGLYTCQTSPRQITLKDITVKEMLFQTALSNPSRR